VKPEPSKQISTGNNVEDMIRAKAISISQGTFVTEKKYNTFIKEYDILEFIGKGRFF
jgi:histidinol phosphatase-like enzyme